MTFPMNKFLKIAILVCLLGGWLWASPPEVEEDARFKGQFGARFTVGPGAEILTSGAPEDVSNLRARFYINPDDLQLGNGGNIVIFAARNNADVNQIELVLQDAGAATQALVRVRLDNGTFVSTNAVTLVRGWQALQVNWSAGDNSGVTELLLNGVSQSQLNSLDNDQSQLDNFQVGVLSEAGASNSGSFDVDNFMSLKTVDPGLTCILQGEFMSFTADFPNRNVLQLMDLLNLTCELFQPPNP